MTDFVNNVYLATLNEKLENDEELEDNFVPTVQYNISTYGADYDVEGIVKRLRRQEILIPPFQRNYVWNQKEASLFVESLLLGLPVPGVFFAREPESNKFLVIDGQQRLKSLQFFYDGYFKPTEGEVRRKVFSLTGVQSRFEGLTYGDLKESDRLKLDNSLIHVTIIKQDAPENDDTSIHYIFDRLNSYGRTLNPQEIRTAIDHGVFIDMLNELNNYENWRLIYGRKSERLKDQELILRFFALFFRGHTYDGSMKEFLNKFSKTNQNPPDNFLMEAKKLFKNVVDIVWAALGEKAFRPFGSLNTAVLDSVMVGIAKRFTHKTDIDLDAVRKVYEELVKDREYVEAVSRATSNRASVDVRLRKSIDKFNNV